MPTTTELTEKYLIKHPSINDCLKTDIINYSKLSRKIAKELKIEKKTSIEAIQIACRRYQNKIKKAEVFENKILKILKLSEIEIKNKIIVCIVEKKKLEKIIDLEKKIHKNSDIIYTIEGSKVYTLITSEKYYNDIKNIFEKTIIKISKDLAMITLKSPKELENTPGVNAYVYSRFREKSINIVEQISCWTDTIIVISDKDIAIVMDFLKF